MNISELVKNKKGTILDVRSTAEFMSGHVKGSVNIPLQEIETRLTEIQKMSAPLILCCASGGRSGQACYFLSSQNIECYNAGSWRDVEYFQA